MTVQHLPRCSGDGTIASEASKIPDNDGLVRAARDHKPLSSIELETEDAAGMMIPERMPKFSRSEVPELDGAIAGARDEDVVLGVEFKAVDAG